jgi:hypothetical protein
MKCPECGADQPSGFERCPCGHVFFAAPRKSLYQGSDDEIHPASRFRGPIRKCAKCGSEMDILRVENMLLNGLIPTGKRLYFHCQKCGKEIKVRSLWRNLLAVPGCLLFVIFFALFANTLDWRVGIFAALLGFYLLALLFEIVTRIRYPSVAATETPAVDKE